MKLVDRYVVYMGEGSRDPSQPDEGAAPCWFKVARNFKNGTEHFEEWKRFRRIMERLRLYLEARRGFMT